MPTIKDRRVLQQEIVNLLPEGAPIPYKEFLAQLSEAGLGEGIGEINGMKAAGMVDRWLESDVDGHVVHFIARPAFRSGQE